MTGSTDLLLSSMHFMQSGQLLIEAPNDVSKEQVDPFDLATLAISQEFIVYALERDDWMNEFLEVMDKKIKTEELESMKPKLKLIIGGQDEG